MRESEAAAHVGSSLWDVRMNAVQWSDDMHRMVHLNPSDFNRRLDGHWRRSPGKKGSRARGAGKCGRDRNGLRGEYRIVRADDAVAVGLARAVAAVRSA